MENNTLISKESMPTISKVLSAFGGLLASLFFMLLVVLTGSDFLESSFALILSVTIIVGTTVVSRFVDHPFLSTAIITFYLAGLALFSFYLASLESDIRMISFFVMVITLVTFFVARGWVLNFLSIFIYNGALMVLITSDRSGYMANYVVLFYGAVLFLLGRYEASLIKKVEGLRPMYAAFFISFMAGLIFSNTFAYRLLIASQIETELNAYDISQGVLSTGIFCGLFYMLYNIIKVLGISNLRDKIVIYLIFALFLVLSFYAPYLSGALFLLLVSFYYGFKVEFGLSVVAMCVAVSRYYYMLDITLLAKSGVLILTGVIVLVIWYLYKRKMRIDEKA